MAIRRRVLLLYYRYNNYRLWTFDAENNWRQSVLYAIRARRHSTRPCYVPVDW